MAFADRFKELSKHAIPDHRLWPDEMRQKIERLPRKVRRVQKKIIDESLKTAWDNMMADSRSGAGYPIDQQLREYLFEYNDRQLGHGLKTLPQSFNVFEGFLEYKINTPANYFTLQQENDHLFSMGDFLDFMTSGDVRPQKPELLTNLEDKIIYNFTPVGDIREFAFLHAGSTRFVVAGFTMVRRDDQLHWALIGGPICDLTEASRHLKPMDKARGWTPPEKAFIEVSPTLEFRAEPLAGTDDVWKTVVFGRFSLSSEKHEVRAVARDQGNTYSIIFDDPEAFGVRDVSSVRDRDRQIMSGMIEELEKERLLFEIAETCFFLSAYFRFKIRLVRQTQRATEISALPGPQKAKLSSVAPTKRPLFRTVTALEIVDIGRAPLIRSYTPPQYKVEVDGFWRRLDPGALGKDEHGKEVKGKTWVRGHLRWRDRPTRESTIFVKASVRGAREKAAAIVASDPTAMVHGVELPAIFPIEIEPETETHGWLYVMRCPLMDDDIYKVGWSSRSPEIRADEISRATGVPLSYIVVESWKVEDARKVEAEVHMELDEFRINRRREFFKTTFETIRKGILAAMGRQAP